MAASQRRAEHAAVLREQADALTTACRESLSHPRDRAAIADRHRVVEDLLRDTDSLRADEERLTWYENTV